MTVHRKALATETVTWRSCWYAVIKENEKKQNTRAQITLNTELMYV